MEETWTILRVLQWTQKRFADRGLGSPRLDAEVLLAHALGVDRVRLYTQHDQPLQAAELGAYRELIRRRLGGEPVAYLVGRREFWSLPLAVDERVLVPRPETELLVETALAFLRGRAAPRVADVGTGSGAVAIAIAHERPDADVYASEIAPGSAEVARANAARLEIPVVVRVGDLLAPIAADAPFTAIVSNPPYIPEGDFDGLPREVQREPRGALLSGPDGLATIDRLLAEAPPCLEPGGLLAIEVGAGQAGEVAARMARAGLVGIEARRDLAGIERVVRGLRAP